MANIPVPETSHPLAHQQRPGAASWLTFGLVFLLMMVDYIDRQIIVSMFPHLKEEFGLSDTQLGGLVSVVALAVGVGVFPIAILVDRWSRTKGILIMGSLWSLATMACGWASSYPQLFASRMVVGIGEAGYGPAGSALLSSKFPMNMRGFILGAFQSAAGIGSIVGVVLGGYITAQWGWRAAFGVVGIPGLLLALLFWFVPDYKTVSVHARSHMKRQSLGALLLAVFKELRSSRTALFMSLGGAMQLAVISTMTTWLPSFFNRVHGLSTQQSGAVTGMSILAFSIGAAVWGKVVDRAGRRNPAHKMYVLSWLCIATTVTFAAAFGAMPVGKGQIASIVLGGFLMSCTLGTVLSTTLDVIHPAFRATAAAFTTLVGNLGIAAGPFLLGVMSDKLGLQNALTFLPLSSLVAAYLFWVASRTYAADTVRATQFSNPD